MSDRRGHATQDKEEERRKGGHTVGSPGEDVKKGDGSGT